MSWQRLRMSCQFLSAASGKISAMRTECDDGREWGAADEDSDLRSYCEQVVCRQIVPVGLDTGM